MAKNNLQTKLTPEEIKKIHYYSSKGIKKSVIARHLKRSLQSINNHLELS